MGSKGSKIAGATIGCVLLGAIGVGLMIFCPPVGTMVGPKMVTAGMAVTAEISASVAVGAATSGAFNALC